ncbi:SET and MYND domain-containing protein 4-like [Dreissena polymorpha]|uniref:Protein-lysine N-methyltransferase SMYD4 n=1 Tax=Dreissena polymorpha TaxID=45954 RepID=A0A9D4MIJ5_DREPO|nr:SET and MYND domain-containing protein 4-like [Dreissena polymorpha]XP_052268104.1 SET and MYND domain-containing protein 4-like [Dreissena polymorpha]XP_052268112.1 SET and MYND domain-containing protein 4-like [Dreissena polymorpha]KAH3876790.1 hypothetical protein DPMN_000640 [Dreissena polymorpha]
MSSETSKEWLRLVKERLEKADQYQQLLQDLSSCKTDVERVSTVDQLEHIHSILTIKASPYMKSDAGSTQAREEGNRLFQKRQYYPALMLYNRSVMLAPAGGDTSMLALALANRSAVLHHMKLYQFSLDDIAAALNYGYPNNIRYKLYEREGKCHCQLGQLSQARVSLNTAIHALQVSQLDKNKMKTLITDFRKQLDKLDDPTLVTNGRKHDIVLRGPLPELSGKGAPGVVTISNAVSVGTSEESGRGLYANADIDVGDVLIVEKPYCSTVLKGRSLHYCHHCSSRVVSPVPCLSCSGVVFCGDMCRKQAWEQYHVHECSILHQVTMANIGLGSLAVKMVLKAGCEYLCTFEQFNCNEDEAHFAERFDGKYNWDDYGSVYRLINHVRDRKIEDVLMYCLEALFLASCIQQTEFFGDEKLDRKRVIIGSHLLRNLMMLPCNAHECSELVYKEGNLPESLSVEVGSAIYPCLSLINHSCDPNVVRHSYKNVCVVRAIRNIPKGSELLDNYGALCALTRTADRRQKLESQYFFTCHCLACTDDYPQYLDLPTDTPVFKCDACNGPVFLPMSQKYTEVPCSCCVHLHDLVPRLGSLAQSDESYRGAMMEVLTSSCKNLTENIAALEGHLQQMDRLLCRPWRDYNDCQEALKQCYALKANCFPASFV